MQRCLARLARSHSIHLGHNFQPRGESSGFAREWIRAVPVMNHHQPESYFQRFWRRGFAAGGGDGDVIVPSMGESISDGTLVSFSKKPGDPVAADDVIAQIETEKVTVDIRSPVTGILKEVTEVGKTVKPGDKIAFVAKGDIPAAAKKKPAETPPPPPKAAEAKAPPPPKEAPKPPPTTPARPQAVVRHDEPQLPPKDRTSRVPMTRLRKRVATRLKDSQNTFALLTTFNDVDMSALMAMRKKHLEEFQEKHGVKLGFMSAFVKAACSALQAQPIVNAVIDGDDIIYRDFVDISVAVGTSKGLVVPVLRGVERMSFSDVEKGITTFAKKANEGKLTIDEMAGGTFTISNGGVYGSLMSTPIVNPPQSAILGMHAIQKRPVVIGNEIVPRPMMYIALTYDHRLIDGREAVLFLKHIKDVVEDPARLLLNL